MKKMSRALLSAVLTVALLLSLAACSNADNHSSTVSSESVSTAETSPCTGRYRKIYGSRGYNGFD